jgi:hypothetical protein
LRINRYNVEVVANRQALGQNYLAFLAGCCQRNASRRTIAPTSKSKSGRIRYPLLPVGVFALSLRHRVLEDRTLYMELEGHADCGDASVNDVWATCQTHRQKLI